MDAKKVLAVLRDVESCGCQKCCDHAGLEWHEFAPECPVSTLIAEAEHEALTGGWKPGSEPPSELDSGRAILLLEKHNKIIHHGYLSARQDEIVYCITSDGFRGVPGNRVQWHDLPPLPEQAAAGNGEAGL